MLRPAALVKRSLIFVHRWLGVALSILFTMWFASGIVMMYWGFPGITPEDRLQRAATLTPQAVVVTPEQAWAALGREGSPASVRITSFDGRPAYEFGGGGRRGGGGVMVFADAGTVRGAADAATIDRAAARWAGLSIDHAKKETVTEVDQWIVGGQLRTLRPLYKYSFDDGQQVYVNGTTGDVMQYTTTESRFWAWLGAIPHWMYFTELRKRQAEWFSFVVYSSMIGTIAALIGVIVAIWMYSPAKRYRNAGVPTSIPYRGWKRWHTIIGLVFGVFTTTWAFSGLLSMGPFPILDTISGRDSAGAGARPPNVAAAIRGGRFDLAAYASCSPAQALALVPGFDARELELTTFDSEPIYLATDAAGHTRIIPVNGSPVDSFDTERVEGVVRKAAGQSLAELKVIDQYDAYYLDRHRKAPLPVVYARMNDPAQTRFYIDPKTVRVVGTYSERNWISRWLYHGLHSLDFPWLYNYRPLWDIVVIALMLGGTAVCITSLVLSWRVIARKVRAALKPLAPVPTEDLPQV